MYKLMDGRAGLISARFGSLRLRCREESNGARDCCLRAE
jgi:hypothetical protein